jgi:hypothetical protein
MQSIRYLTLALLVVIGLGGCAIGATSGDDGPPVVQPIEERDNAGSTNDQSEDQSYIGRTITISGPVQQVYADGLFSVATTTDDFDLDRTDTDVLVIAPEAQVVVGQEVEVNGEIRIFDVEEAARLAGTAISAEQALALEGKLMIIADNFSAAGG